MIILYGIANCDTVRKARRWLDDRNIAYRFHDFRSDGLEAAMVARWIAALGWEAMLNKRGTTFRKLPDVDKQDLDADKAAALMIEYPTLIKRPLVEDDHAVSVGFDSTLWERRFGADKQ